MKIKNNLILIISIIVIILLITIGLSFAYFSANITGGEETTTITATGGIMKITYDGGQKINLKNIIPDNKPALIKTITITGDNNTDLEMKYKLNLVIEKNTFSEEAIKYKLVSRNTNNNGEIIPDIVNLTNIGANSSKIELGIGSFESPTGGARVHTYNLEIYFPNQPYNQNIDQGKELEAFIEMTKYDSHIPGFNESKMVNSPVLFTGMTPVVWDGNNFVETNKNDPSWYDYYENKWANARSKDGSYWVWIPRYAYKITSGYRSSTTGAIDVKFLKGTTNQNSDNIQIETEGYNPGIKDTSMHYFLHPAFVFNDDELGFWVAKYEATAAEGIDTVNNNCSPLDNVTTKTVKIIANASPWRCMNNFTAFNVSLNMKNKSDIYGWLKSEVDSHLIKNIEWGAVTYLSKSKYGVGTEEIWNNSYNGYMTGCSGSSVDAVDENTCIMYNTQNGQKASTTHNVYGVYDMSGGSSERVAANYNNLPGASGFTTEELSNIPPKYIDKYITPPENMLGGVGMDYDVTKYGDAVHETSNNPYRFNGNTWSGNPRGSWYGDYSYLPNNSAWFSRGGHFTNDSSAGIFYFFSSNGPALVTYSFRPVLFAEK